MSVRDRLIRALRGERITHPVYVVYDAFLPNPVVDWDYLFSLGLGQVNHAFVAEAKHPNCEIVETTRREGDLVRRDVTIKTIKGELHEYYLGDSGKGVLDWRMEHFIKEPSDYAIMLQALEGTQYTATDRAFDESEIAIGDRGITLAHVDRTPFQKIQIDYSGLETFAYHLADEVSELFDLLELMNQLKLAEFEAVAHSKAEYVKLWENIGIDAVGPLAYRKYIVPLYEKIVKLFSEKGKRLIVHYDGQIRLIAEDIARIGFDIDSLTPPPEGDMQPEELRTLWPDTFFWLHPSLTWFSLPEDELALRIKHMVSSVGPYRYCFELSEGIPSNWKEGIPVVLEALSGS